MTANASPAVLAPVDVAAVLATMERVSRERNGIPALDAARAAVEQMAAELATAREEVALLRNGARREELNFMAQLSELRQRAEAAEADAAIGRVVWRYIDRMNDVCESDPAEKILAEFVAAVGPAIDAALQEQPGQ